MRGVGQDQRAITVGEDVPDRLPIDAARFHRDMGAAALCQPGSERQEPRRRGLERAHLRFRRLVSCQPNCGHHRIPVHIEACAARVENVHCSLRDLRRRRRAPLDQSLNNALADLAALAQSGVLGMPRVQLIRGLVAPWKSQPLRRPPADNATGFIHGGSAFRWRTNTKSS
jgi:hypothetical protein